MWGARMVIREHKKLWKNPVVFWVIAAGFFINLFLLVRSEYGRNAGLDVTVDKYNQCYSKIEQMEPEEAKEYLSGILRQKEENSEVSLEYSDYLTYTLILQEISNTGLYDDYLEERESELENRASFAIFGEADDYSARSSRKTLSVLRKFRGRNIDLAPSRGVRMVMNYFTTDIVGVLVLLFACAAAFMQEKERGEHIFVRTCADGREKLILSKIISMNLFAGEVVLILFGGNIFAADFIYGLGPLERSIQSVDGYIGTGYDGTVAKTIVAFMLFQWLCYILLTMGILLFMVCCRKASGVYVCVCLWLGVSGGLYYQIEENSRFSIFKNINIIGYLNTGRIFENYRNINLLGVPVAYSTVFLVTVAAGSLFLAGFVLAVFCAQKIPDQAGVMSRISFKISDILGTRERMEGDRCTVRKQVYLTAFWFREGKKIFLHLKILILLLIFAGLIWYTYTPVSSIYSDQNDIYYKNYIDQLSGPYSKEKEKEILAWERKMEKWEEQEAEELQKAETELAKTVISEKYSKRKKSRQALDTLISHMEYLQDIPKGSFYYSRGYERLTGGNNAGNGDITHALTGVLMLVLCLTGIYSVEYESGMMRLLKAAPKGRKDLHVVKGAAGFLITTTIFLLVYLPWFYNVLSAYGTVGLHDPVISMEHISPVYSGMSVLQYLILITFFRYLAFLLIMCVIFFLSSRTKSFILTVAISVGVFILPLLIYMSGIEAAKLLFLNPFLLGNI